jgi:hypothetical protein
MTKTKRSLLIVFVIQALMAAALGIFFGTLKEVVSHNPVVNSAIISVLVGSMIYSFIAALLVYRGESKWSRAAGESDSPASLKAVCAHFPELGHADPARRVAGIDALNESLEWRGRMLDYASGVLIGLGLLGTFVGLMHTMAGIKEAMALVSGAGGKASATALIGGLAAPLAGMSTAFSASLLGLIGSLAVGALAQFLSRSSSNWVESIREWAHENAGDTPVQATAVTGSDAAVLRIEQVAIAIQACVGQFVQETNAARNEQTQTALGNSAVLGRIAAATERQQALLGTIQQDMQANTAAMSSARQAVVSMAGSVEANRVQVTAAIDSVVDTLIDIKSHTGQTVVRLDTLQNGLTSKYASLEKVSASMQMQRHAVIDCVEQIGRARVAIESARGLPTSLPVASTASV